jgi:hypothetical protein
MQSVIARPQPVGMAAIGGGIASQVTIHRMGIAGAGTHPEPVRSRFSGYGAAGLPRILTRAILVV